jgi:hypothetical protein
MDDRPLRAFSLGTASPNAAIEARMMMATVATSK